MATSDAAPALVAIAAQRQPSDAEMKLIFSGLSCSSKRPSRRAGTSAAVQSQKVALALDAALLAASMCADDEALVKLMTTVAVTLERIATWPCSAEVVSGLQALPFFLVLCDKLATLSERAAVLVMTTARSLIAFQTVSDGIMVGASDQDGDESEAFAGVVAVVKRSRGADAEPPLPYPLLPLLLDRGLLCCIARFVSSGAASSSEVHRSCSTLLDALGRCLDDLRTRAAVEIDVPSLLLIWQHVAMLPALDGHHWVSNDADSRLSYAAMVTFESINAHCQSVASLLSRILPSLSLHQVTWLARICCASLRAVEDCISSARSTGEPWYADPLCVMKVLQGCQTYCMVLLAQCVAQHAFLAPLVLRSRLHNWYAAAVTQWMLVHKQSAVLHCIYRALQPDGATNALDVESDDSSDDEGSEEYIETRFTTTDTSVRGLGIAQLRCATSMAPAASVEVPDAVAELFSAPLEAVVAACMPPVADDAAAAHDVSLPVAASACAAALLHTRCGSASAAHEGSTPTRIQAGSVALDATPADAEQAPAKAGHKRRREVTPPVPFTASSDVTPADAASAAAPTRATRSGGAVRARPPSKTASPRKRTPARAAAVVALPAIDVVESTQKLIKWVLSGQHQRRQHRGVVTGGIQRLGLSYSLSQGLEYLDAAVFDALCISIQRGCMLPMAKAVPCKGVVTLLGPQSFGPVSLADAGSARARLRAADAAVRRPAGIKCLPLMKGKLAAALLQRMAAGHMMLSEDLIPRMQRASGASDAKLLLPPRVSQVCGTIMRLLEVYALYAPADASASTSSETHSTTSCQPDYGSDEVLELCAQLQRQHGSADTLRLQVAEHGLLQGFHTQLTGLLEYAVTAEDAAWVTSHQPHGTVATPSSPVALVDASACVEALADMNMITGSAWDYGTTHDDDEEMDEDDDEDEPPHVCTCGLCPQPARRVTTARTFVPQSRQVVETCVHECLRLLLRLLSATMPDGSVTTQSADAVRHIHRWAVHAVATELGESCRHRPQQRPSIELLLAAAPSSVSVDLVHCAAAIVSTCAEHAAFNMTPQDTSRIEIAVAAAASRSASDIVTPYEFAEQAGHWHQALMTLLPANVAPPALVSITGVDGLMRLARLSQRSITLFAESLTPALCESCPLSRWGITSSRAPLGAPARLNAARTTGRVQLCLQRSNIGCFEPALGDVTVPWLANFDTLESAVFSAVGVDVLGPVAVHSAEYAAFAAALTGRCVAIHPDRVFAHRDNSAVSMDAALSRKASRRTGAATLSLLGDIDDTVSMPPVPPMPPMPAMRALTLTRQRSVDMRATDDGSDLPPAAPAPSQDAGRPRLPRVGGAAAWLPAEVTAYDSTTGTHTLRYENGFEEGVLLAACEYRMLRRDVTLASLAAEAAAAAPVPPPRPSAAAAASTDAASDASRSIVSVLSVSEDLTARDEPVVAAAAAAAPASTVAATPAVVEPPPTDWACAACTYLNPWAQRMCTICGTGEPASVTDRRAAADPRAPDAAPASVDSAGRPLVTVACPACTFINPVLEHNPSQQQRSGTERITITHSGVASSSQPLPPALESWAFTWLHTRCSVCGSSLRPADVGVARQRMRACLEQFNITSRESNRLQDAAQALRALDGMDEQLRMLRAASRAGMTSEEARSLIDPVMFMMTRIGGGAELRYVPTGVTASSESAPPIMYPPSLSGTRLWSSSGRTIHFAASSALLTGSFVLGSATRQPPPRELTVDALARRELFREVAWDEEHTSLALGVRQYASTSATRRADADAHVFGRESVARVVMEAYSSPDARWNGAPHQLLAEPHLLTGDADSMVKLDVAVNWLTSKPRGALTEARTSSLPMTVPQVMMARKARLSMLSVHAIYSFTHSRAPASFEAWCVQHAGHMVSVAPQRVFWNEALMFALRLTAADVIASTARPQPCWLSYLLTNAVIHDVTPVSLRRHMLSVYAFSRVRALSAMQDIEDARTALDEALTPPRYDDDMGEPPEPNADFLTEDVFTAASIAVLRARSTERLGAVARDRISISRANLLADARLMLHAHAAGATAHANLEVRFAEEKGVGTGVVREFYACLANALAGAELKVPTGRQSLSHVVINPWHAQSTPGGVAHHQEGLFPQPVSDAKHVQDAVSSHFDLLGIALGRALHDGQVLPIRLSVHVFSILLRMVKQGNALPPSLHAARAAGARDLDERKVVHAVLNDNLLTNVCLAFYPHVADLIRGEFSEAEMEAMCLSWQHPANQASLAQFEFFPGLLHSCVEEAFDENASVTAAALPQFTARFVWYTAVKGVQAALDSIMSGLQRIVNDIRLLWLFSPIELCEMACGSLAVEWDARSLKAAIRTSGGYNASSPQLDMFVSALIAMSVRERSEFLQFATGCPSLPPGGLAALEPPLTIVRKMDASLTVPGRTMQLSSGGSTAEADAHGIVFIDVEDNVMPGESPATRASSAVSTASIMPISAATAVSPHDVVPISASTCFSQVKLPPYSSTEVMLTQLRFAMSASKGLVDLT